MPKPNRGPYLKWRIERNSWDIVWFEKGQRKRKSLGTTDREVADEMLYAYLQTGDINGRVNMGKFRFDSQCRIYFIQAPNRLIKIGRSLTPVARFTDIQTMSPVPLTLRNHYPETWQVNEDSLHQLFAQDRAHGEWFKQTPLLLRVSDCKDGQEAEALLRNKGLIALNKVA